MRFSTRSLAILLLTLSAIWIAVTALFIPLPRLDLVQAPRDGFQAPDFSLTDLAGNTTSLNSLRGQIVLINFWASWCPPCKAEMPELQELVKEYPAGSFSFLAINLTSNDNLPQVTALVQENGYDFPVLLDNNHAVADRYQVRLIPTSFLADQDGVIRHVFIGRATQAEFRGWINSLQKEP